MIKMLLLLIISGLGLIPSSSSQSLSQGVAKLSLALSANLGNPFIYKFYPLPLPEQIAFEIIWLNLEFETGNLDIFMSKPWKTGEGRRDRKMPKFGFLYLYKRNIDFEWLNGAKGKCLSILSKIKIKGLKGACCAPNFSRGGDVPPLYPPPLTLCMFNYDLSKILCIKQALILEN